MTQVMVGGSHVATSVFVALTSCAIEQDPVVRVTVMVGPSSTAGVTADGTRVAGAQNLQVICSKLLGKLV